MRIATWNLAGRWSAQHASLIDNVDADIWLLTEVSERVLMDGYRIHRTALQMAPRRSWAAIASCSAFEPLPDPHPATAAAVIDSMYVCASVLPWRSAGGPPAWNGRTTAEKAANAIEQIRTQIAQLDMWGGDWNHALHGREYAGSRAGRAELIAALRELSLRVPTALLGHHLAGLLTIDHVALGERFVINAARRVRVGRLSDHDAYVVDAELLDEGMSTAD